MNMIYIIIHFCFTMSTVSLAPPPRTSYFQPKTIPNVNATHEESSLDSEEFVWLIILITSLTIFVYTFLKSKS